MLARRLEPEVMDTESDAVDYDAMDHSLVNQAFAREVMTAVGLHRPENHAVWQTFDAGTGTGLIPIELLRLGFPGKIVAADAAEQMLILGRVRVREAGFADRITFVRRDCKQLPEGDATFDVVMSNSLIHHIPEPAVVLRECWRILKPGGLLFVRDLCRPTSESMLAELVATYAAEANPRQRQLFADSLWAALTIPEAQTLIAELGLSPTCVTMTSDRHWTLTASKP